MAEQMNMDDILSDAPPPPVEPQEAPQEQGAEQAAEPVASEPVVEPKERNTSSRKRHKEREDAARAEGEGKVRDASGKFVAKPEEPAPVEAAAPVAPVTPPAQEFTDKEKAFLRVAQEERTKRQQLEQRIAAMEKTAEPAKAFWDDPEAKLQEMRQEIQGVAVNTRLNTAEMIARQRHPDFDEKIAVFAEIIQRTPGLHGQWLQAQDPAEFAYTTGKNFQEVQKLGSIDAMMKDAEAKTEARVRAQVEAEYKAKAEADAKTRAAIPGSLSNAHGAPMNRVVWNGPTSLDDVLKP